MVTYFVVRRALFVLGLLAVPALAGCQTVAGFGRDVQHAGRWITGGAQQTETWVFGPQDQAAEARNANGSMDTSAGPQRAMTPVARAADAGDNVVYFATGSADIPPDGMAEIRDIATASTSSSMQSSDNGTMQSSDNASMQSSDNGSMQSSNNGSMQSSDNASMQSSDNGTMQNSDNASMQSSASNSGQSGRMIQVIGYTDTAGSADYNRKLSERRAEAVADALAAQGVPRDSIDVQWHGEDQLPVPTADGVSEPQNRRVRITMMGG